MRLIATPIEREVIFMLWTLSVLVIGVIAGALLQGACRP